jgi:PII-like signaling protein
MDTLLLKLYMHENRKHDHILLYEWLLAKAKQLGIGGVTVLHGIAGYGRNGVVHEQHFLELAGDLPVQVELLAGRSQVDALLALLAREKISLLYVKIPVESGFVPGDF